MEADITVIPPFIKEETGSEIGHKPLTTGTSTEASPGQVLLPTTRYCWKHTKRLGEGVESRVNTRGSLYFHLFRAPNRRPRDLEGRAWMEKANRKNPSTASTGRGQDKDPFGFHRGSQTHKPFQKGKNQWERVQPRGPQAVEPSAPVLSK